MAGITRQKTIDTARKLGLTVLEQDYTLSDVYAADEVFVTGTFPSQVPVREVDGRAIGHGSGAAGPVTKSIQEAYKADVKAGIQKGRQAAIDSVTE